MMRRGKRTTTEVDPSTVEGMEVSSNDGRVSKFVPPVAVQVDAIQVSDEVFAAVSSELCEMGMSHAVRGAMIVIDNNTVLRGGGPSDPSGAEGLKYLSIVHGLRKT